MDQELLFFALLTAGLLVVIFVHELGHLLAARHYGVKVLSLSVGFGPQLISFTVSPTAAAPVGNYGQSRSAAVAPLMIS